MKVGRAAVKTGGWLVAAGVVVFGVVSTGLVSQSQADTMSVTTMKGVGHGSYDVAKGLLTWAQTMSSDFAHHKGEPKAKPKAKPKASKAPVNRTFHSSGMQPAPKN